MSPETRAVADEAYKECKPDMTDRTLQDIVKSAKDLRYPGDAEEYLKLFHFDDDELWRMEYMLDKDVERDSVSVRRLAKLCLGIKRTA